VRLYTYDAYVCLSVFECALLIMVDLGRWLYLVVTFIEVKAITVVSSLRAKTGINTTFVLSKKSYATPKFHSRFGIAFNVIHRMYQSNMNLKT
jgi:hypothetical protein